VHPVPIEACVLFVDDEPHVTAALRAALRREPFRILTADSGAEALALLGAEEIDVVVSDERMPGMGGTDLLTEVRRRRPDTLRMLLTGQTSLDLLIRAVNEGHITHFFSKPCHPADLAQVIHQALRLRALEKENTRLERANHQQAALLRRLEIAHPGITEVRRDATGAILIDDE
jgi:two-component system, probable response regulator PhcQ